MEYLFETPDPKRAAVHDPAASAARAEEALQDEESEQGDESDATGAQKNTGEIENFLDILRRGGALEDDPIPYELDIEDAIV